MAKLTKIALGKKAGIFHDQSTGITIKKGEIKELTDNQLKSKRVRQALNGGHLVVAVEKGFTEDKVKDNIDDLNKKFSDLVSNGTDNDKIAKSFNFDQLKMLAEKYEIELEESDTKVDVVKALVENLE